MFVKCGSVFVKKVPVCVGVFAKEACVCADLSVLLVCVCLCVGGCMHLCVCRFAGVYGCVVCVSM